MADSSSNDGSIMTRSSPRLRPAMGFQCKAHGKRCSTPLLLSAAGTGILLSLCACTHDGLGEEEDMVTPTVQQRLAIDFNYDGHGYELASTYTDTMGHTFRLDTLCFLISAIQAEDDDQSVITQFEGVDLVPDAGGSSNDFALGPLTAGHLHQLRFHFGLAPEENHAGPPQPLDTALVMIYSGASATGYHFLVVSGQVDGNGDGSLDVGDPRFSFKCTGDAMLRSNIAPVHENLIQGGVLTAWLPLDIEKLLAGIDLLATPSSNGSGPINARLMNQLVTASTQTH